MTTDIVKALFRMRSYQAQRTPANEAGEAPAEVEILVPSDRITCRTVSLTPKSALIEGYERTPEHLHRFHEFFAGHGGESLEAIFVGNDLSRASRKSLAAFQETGPSNMIRSVGLLFEIPANAAAN
ncbi:MAG: hypothetical protein A2Z34_07495 [Planctomycetes bacterium RBG_16_59_8]|nr:MAG: hypothetical protein A2Z34_07495 [Planctomycetes bacterium RBG_16_59_8]